MDNESVKTSITIMTVGDVKEVGDKKIPLLTFKAKDDKGIEHNYQTYKQDLFEVLKANTGKDIDIDLTIKQNGDYINRSVIQVYISGKPVIVKQPFIKAAGGNSKIQVAIKAIVDLRIAKIIDDSNTDYQAALKWITETIKQDGVK